MRFHVTFSDLGDPANHDQAPSRRVLRFVMAATPLAVDPIEWSDDPVYAALELAVAGLEDRLHEVAAEYGGIARRLTRSQA